MISQDLRNLEIPVGYAISSFHLLQWQLLLDLFELSKVNIKADRWIIYTAYYNLRRWTG